MIILAKDLVGQNWLFTLIKKQPSHRKKTVLLATWPFMAQPPAKPISAAKQEKDFVFETQVPG